MDTPRIFEPAYYQRLYDIETAHWWSLGMRDAMVVLLQDLLAGSNKLKVLDAGCGTGFLMKFLSGDLDKLPFPAVGDVVGLDYSFEALRFCQMRNISALLQADVASPPFAAESFDLIICIDTLQHLWPSGTDNTALSKFARLLRPSGMLYLRTNSALGHPPLRGVDPALYRRYRRPELVAMLEATGLRVERATYLNCLPSVWGMIREFRATWTSRQTDRHSDREIGPGLSIQLPRSKLLARLLYGILTVETRIIGKMRVNLPFGHSLALTARKPS